MARLEETVVQQIDLLLMIDNSRSMADKQQVLVQALPDLVAGLVNPRCVDAASPLDQSRWCIPGQAGPLPERRPSIRAPPGSRATSTRSTTSTSAS